MEPSAGPAPHALPQVLVGVLVALSIGAIVLSLSTAPPDLVEQLRVAANATAAAPSFVLTDTGRLTSALPGLSPAAQRQLSTTDRVHVVYQAPDRVYDQTTATSGAGSAPVATIVVIGSTHYSYQDGHWDELRPQSAIGRSAAQVVLFPLQAAACATVVTRQGAAYTFIPAHLDLVTSTLLGSPLARLTSVSVTAVVQGDHVSRETVSALRGAERLSLDLVFSSIGTAPPVDAPPPSQIVAYRGPSSPAPAARPLPAVCATGVSQPGAAG